MIMVFFQVAFLILLLWITFRVYRLQPPTVKYFFFPALVLKMVAGLALGYLYFSYYGEGDTVNYWLDGNTIADKIINDPATALRFYWEDDPSVSNLSGLINDKPRSVFFIKVAGLLSLATGGQYVLMSMFISFLSFLAAWYAFRKWLAVFPDAVWPAAISFLYFPSVVFWSSGLIKESLGLSSLLVLSGFFLTYYKQEKIRIAEWVMAVILFWIGWNLKYYWMGIFIPVVLTTTIVVQLCRQWPAFFRFELMLWAVIFAFLLLGASGLHPNFYPGQIINVIWENNQEFMSLTQPENGICFDNLQPDFWSMMANSPEALLAGIFRPFIWESHNLVSVFACIENTAILMLVITAATGVRRFFSSRYKILSLAVIMYTFLLAIFLALSTPNFGTLSRYKIGFLPFFIFLILYCNPVIAWIEQRLPLRHNHDKS